MQFLKPYGNNPPADQSSGCGVNMGGVPHEEASNVSNINKKTETREEEGWGCISTFVSWYERVGSFWIEHLRGIYNTIYIAANNSVSRSPGVIN